MRRLDRFQGFRLTEKAEPKPKGDKTLYRLLSHPVVDLSKPGRFYVSSKGKLDPSILKKKGDNLYVATVTCPAANVDEAASERESAKHDRSGIVVVKDDAKCQVVKVEPFDKK